MPQGTIFKPQSGFSARVPRAIRATPAVSKFRSRAVIEFGTPIDIPPELVEQFKQGERRESVRRARFSNHSPGSQPGCLEPSGRHQLYHISKSVNFGTPIDIPPELVEQFKQGERRESVGALLDIIYGSLVPLNC
jgi:hypothetical protein